MQNDVKTVLFCLSLLQKIHVYTTTSTLEIALRCKMLNRIGPCFHFISHHAFDSAESGHPARLLHAAVPVQMHTAKPDEENRERIGVKESCF